MFRHFFKPALYALAGMFLVYRPLMLNVLRISEAHTDLTALIFKQLRFIIFSSCHRICNTDREKHFLCYKASGQFAVFLDKMTDKTRFSKAYKNAVIPNYT